MTDQPNTAAIRDMLQNRRAQGWSSGLYDDTILALCDALDDRTLEANHASDVASAAIAEVRMLQACVTHAMGDVHDLLGVATDDEVDAILAAWSRLNRQMPDTDAQVIEKLQAENERLQRAWQAKHENQVKATKDAEEYFDNSQQRMRELKAENERLRIKVERMATQITETSNQARYRRAEIKGHQRRIVSLQKENERLLAILKENNIAYY